MARLKNIAKWVAIVIAALACAFLVLLSQTGYHHGPTYEAGAIGDTRNIISAEAAYQSANRNHYDTLECLLAPSRCIPGYVGPTFLDERLYAPTHNGYVHEFHAGRVTRPEQVAYEGASPSSLETFAYVSLPMKRDGYRGVCSDFTGVICMTPTGGRPRLEGGQCVMDAVAMPQPHRWPWSPLPDEEPCYALR